MLFEECVMANGQLLGEPDPLLWVYKKLTLQSWERVQQWNATKVGNKSLWILVSIVVLEWYVSSLRRDIAKQAITVLSIILAFLHDSQILIVRALGYVFFFFSKEKLAFLSCKQESSILSFLSRWVKFLYNIHHHPWVMLFAEASTNLWSL